MALAVEDADEIEQDVDPGVGDGADDEGRAEADQRLGMRQIVAVGPQAAGADDDAARPGARVGVIGAQPAEERRRSVG